MAPLVHFKNSITPGAVPVCGAAEGGGLTIRPESVTCPRCRGSLGGENGGFFLAAREVHRSDSTDRTRR